MKRVALVLLAVAVVVAAYSCGETEPPPNRAPRAVGSIPAQELMAFDTVLVDVSQYFTDEDGDALTYSAVSAAPVVLSASTTGSLLSIAGRTAGQGGVTVTARDPDGLSATQQVGVTVLGRPGFLNVELRYDEQDVGAVVVRLEGPPADSVRSPAGFSVYHAAVAGGTRAFVAGAIPGAGTLLRFWTEDVSSPGAYRGHLEQAAGTDYRQRPVEEGRIRIFR